MEDDSPFRSLSGRESKEGKNGRPWIYIAGVGVSLLVFLTGWWGGQRTAWTEAGSQAEKIRALEATVQSQGAYLRDVENQATRALGVAAQADREADKARDDVKELRQIIYRGWGK